jgi:hypothetical protein
LQKKVQIRPHVNVEVSYNAADELLKNFLVDQDLALYLE